MSENNQYYSGDDRLWPVIIGSNRLPKNNNRFKSNRFKSSVYGDNVTEPITIAGRPLSEIVCVSFKDGLYYPDIDQIRLDPFRNVSRTNVNVNAVSYPNHWNEVKFILNPNTTPSHSDIIVDDVVESLLFSMYHVLEFDKLTGISYTGEGTSRWDASAYVINVLLKPYAMMLKGKVNNVQLNLGFVINILIHVLYHWKNVETSNAPLLIIPTPKQQQGFRVSWTYVRHDYDSANTDNVVQLEFVHGDGSTTIVQSSGDGFSNEIDNAVTLENVLSFRILPSTTSVYIDYWVGSESGNPIRLYNKGSGNPSDVVTLTDNIIIDYHLGTQECMLSDTLVSVDSFDGDVLLSEVNVGDKLISINFDATDNANTLVKRSCIQSSNDENHPEYVVYEYLQTTLSNGVILKNAYPHRIYCVDLGKYEYLNNLWIGAKTIHLSAEGEPKIVSIIDQRFISAPDGVNFCRITLEDSNNFFINGVPTGDRRCPSISVNRMMALLNVGLREISGGDE